MQKIIFYGVSVFVTFGNILSIEEVYQQKKTNTYVEDDKGNEKEIDEYKENERDVLKKIQSLSYLNSPDRVNEVIEKEEECHPNYTKACVPIVTDVDCAGGRGNGPAYVEGPVKVIGKDVYKLDGDRDGWGCE